MCLGAYLCICVCIACVCMHVSLRVHEDVCLCQCMCLLALAREPVLIRRDPGLDPLYGLSRGKGTLRESEGGRTAWECLMLGVSQAGGRVLRGQWPRSLLENLPAPHTAATAQAPACPTPARAPALCPRYLWPRHADG